MTVHFDIHHQLWTFVEPYWRPNELFGHGPDHAQRAYRIGISMAIIEKADPLVTGAACYLMDSGLNLADGRENHIQRSEEIARYASNEIPELKAVIEQIVLAIRYHEGDEPCPDDLPIEALIVRDADTIDRLGFSGIRMTLKYGLWMHRPLCNSEDPLCLRRSPDLNGYSMDYIRYLFRLPDLLSTSAAHDFGRYKATEQHLYCDHFNRLCSHGIPSYDDAFRLIRELEVNSLRIEDGK